MRCNQNCNQGRTCDCVENEAYAASTNGPATSWDKAYMMRQPITMEESNPMHDLLRDIRSYATTALAGIGILAVIVFIGAVSAGYFK